MKKVFSIFLVVGLIFAVVGCSNGEKADSASGVVKSYLEAIDKVDMPAANELVEPDFQEDPEELHNLFNELGSKEIFELYLSDISPEVKEETVDGDTATVTVLVHPYDKESQSKIMEEIFTAAMSAPDASEEEQSTLIRESIQNIDKDSLTRIEKEVNMKATKIDGKWYIAGDGTDELLTSLMSFE